MRVPRPLEASRFNLAVQLNRSREQDRDPRRGRPRRESPPSFTALDYTFQGWGPHSVTSHSIVLIGTWFGSWPPWIDFFLVSCGVNRNVDWLIFTDQPAPPSTPSNVRIVVTSFSDYKSLLGQALNISVHDNANEYKLCDFRPALGHVHHEYIKGYDFFGYTDFDVIYGDIRGIYDDHLLARYDALATHTMHISGHLFLMRNTKEMRTAFMSIKGWRDMYQAPRHVNVDENEFYKSYFASGRSRRSRVISLGRRRPFYFREAYSTPMPTTDMRWYWKGGVLSNEFYPHKSFLYLHFMVWHSNKWYLVLPNVTPGAAAPWQGRDDIVQIDWQRGREEGFMISPAGIGPIEVRAYP